MKQFSKYDPEDIESLLLHKQFNELYPEEKEFVLRHLDGVEEYESMRRMLLELKNSEGTDEWLTPDPSIKKALMAEFARERKGRFSIWLNSLFAMPERPIYMQRGVQWSFGVAVIAGAFFFLKPNGNQTLLAENQKTENLEGTAAKSDTTINEAVIAANQKTVVDTSMSNVIPAAPKVLAMAAPAPSVQLDEQVATTDSESKKNVERDFAKAASIEMPTADGSLAESNDEVTVTTNSLSDSNTGNTFTMTSPASANVQNVTLSSKSFEFVAVANTGSMANYNDLLDLMFTAK